MRNPGYVLNNLRKKLGVNGNRDQPAVEEDPEGSSDAPDASDLENGMRQGMYLPELSPKHRIPMTFLLWELLVVGIFLGVVAFCILYRWFKLSVEFEIGDLVLTPEGNGWVCGTKNGLCVKLLSDKLFKEGLMFDHKSVKLIKQRFPKSCEDEEGEQIPNLITTCLPVEGKYICPWCKLSDGAEKLVSDTFGYPECCQDYFACCAPQGAEKRKSNRTLNLQSWCQKHHHKGGKCNCSPNQKYYCEEFLPVLKHIAKSRGGDGALPAGLTQWGPCQKCFGPIKDIVDNTTTFADRKKQLRKHLEQVPSFSKRESAGYSMNTEIDTPFEPEFFKAMKRHVGGDKERKQLALEVLQAFHDVVFKDQTVGGCVSRGFPKQN